MRRVPEKKKPPHALSHTPAPFCVLSCARLGAATYLPPFPFGQLLGLDEVRGRGGGRGSPHILTHFSGVLGQEREGGLLASLVLALMEVIQAAQGYLLKYSQRLYA